jgi:hypothetical protein
MKENHKITFSLQMYFLEQGHPTFGIIFHLGNYGDALQCIVKKWPELQIIITEGG